MERPGAFVGNGFRPRQAILLVAAGAAGVAVASLLLASRAAQAGLSRAAHGGSHTNIYFVSTRGTGLTRITDNRESDESHLAFDPSFSPDGSRILFTETPCHGCASEIHSMPARPARGPRWLGPKIALGFSPRWSPNGKRIAFVDSGGIYLARSNGSGRRLLVKRGLADHDPSWSPDGKRIAFTQQETASNWRLYVIGDDGRGLRPIAAAGTPAVNPAWSPQGRTIAYAVRQALWQIAVTTADGRSRRTLSNGRWSDSFPVWSPDGRRLAFVRQEKAGTAIFVMNADGSGVRRLSPRWMSAVQPAWSPQGDRIAFAGDRKE